jgi:hypothetical protein
LGGGVSLRIVLVAATVLVAVAAVRAGVGPAQPRLTATAGGAVAVESTHDGRALMRVGDLRPGHGAEGTLTLTNRSAVAQALVLASTGVVDRAGGDRLLSSQLDLRITTGEGDEVYAGKLGGLPAELDLGELPAGSAREFRLVAGLPEQGPAVDDAFAGSSVDWTWTWNARAGVAPEPERLPEPEVVAPAAPVERPRDPETPAPSRVTERADDSSVLTDPEGPAPRGARTVRLWLGGGAVQRLRRGVAAPRAGGRPGTGFLLQARCRPGCSLQASAEVRVGRRVRRLGRRALGTVESDRGATRVGFALKPGERRWLTRALRRGTATVTVTVRATAPGHGDTSAVRTVRLRR